MQFVKNVSYTSSVSSPLVFFVTVFYEGFIPKIILKSWFLLFICIKNLLNVFRFDTAMLRDSCAVLLLKTLSRLPQSVKFSAWFPFCAFVTMICWTSTEMLPNLDPHLDSALLSLAFEEINIFELPVLILSVFYLIHSVLAEGYLNFISPIQFRCSFFYIEWIKIWFAALIPLALHSLPLWFSLFQQRAL